MSYLLMKSSYFIKIIKNEKTGKLKRQQMQYKYLHDIFKLCENFEVVFLVIKKPLTVK